MTTADDVFENTYGQVGDTTSVDALRTRLARAFEVAALRDPSADLAAFEAAVRRDAVAVDREALAKVLYDSSADLALTRLGAQAMADAILASGILSLAPEG